MTRETARRLAQCASCPQRVGGRLQTLPEGALLMATHRCNLCKCFLYAKAALPWERCPQRLW